MNIWLIKVGESPPSDASARKLRMAMLSDSLIAGGHSVVWWTSAFDHFRKKWIFKEDAEMKVTNSLTIKALKGIGYRRNISFYRFIDHRIIASKFVKSASRMKKPDIIVSSMPPHDLAYQAALYAKRNKIPIIVDIRDPWPDIFIDNFPFLLRRIGKLILLKDFYMIKKTMKMADSLVAVSKTFLNWGLKYAGRQISKNDKVFYLGAKRIIENKPNKENNSYEFIKKLKDKFVVLFIGTFSSYHNPEILLDCAEKLKDEKICFVLAGNGEFFRKIQKRARALHNVVLPGWLNNYQIDELLKYSNVGICPTSKTVDLLPNKVFTYLSAGLPVISAFQGDLKEIIEEYRIGFNYPPNELDVLVDGIKRLYSNPRLYKEMSQNAANIFRRFFDSDIIYEEYAQHIIKNAMSLN